MIATCSWCQAPRGEGTNCPKCGANFAKADKNHSWEAEHPTVQALSRYMGEGEDKGTIVWGPDCGPKAVSDAISYCLSGVFGAVLVCAEDLGAQKS